LAEHLKVSARQIGAIVRGERGVGPDVAWLLSQAFGTTPEFWLDLQARHDLARARPRRSVRPLRRAG
jgi:addiction module HigA family antidote